VGLLGGLGSAKFGSSLFGMNYGCFLQYSWNNEYINFSYNHLPHFEINFSNTKSYDVSKFNRLELSYGRITCLKESQKLLRHIYFSGSIGISYNYINYYLDEYVLSSSKMLITEQFGVSLSGAMLIMNFWGTEFKYHIISNFKPYVELGAIVKIKVL